MEHHFCVFYKNDRLQFGWIKEIRKNKLVVIPEQGKEFNCAPSRVEYIWKAKEFSDEKEAVAYLTEKSTWVHQEAEKLELEVIHELCEPDQAYTIDDLAENFLEDYEDGWVRVSLLFRLKNEAKLFQQKKNQFFARTEEEILEIESQLEKRRQQEERQQVEKSWATDLLSHKHPEINEEQEEHWNQFLNRTIKFLIHLERSQEKDYFCSLFEQNIKDQEKLERRIIDCLAITNEPISWGRLIIERSSVDFNFSGEEQAESSKILGSDLWSTPFEIETHDLRELKTFSVDNEGSKDFDDALNWEPTYTGKTVRVFITDVASFIAYQSQLFLGASDRISSLYTLKKVFPMFPAELSEGQFSLKQSEDRAVLTFEFEVNDSNEVVDSKIYRSVIQVDKNCTYSEIDEEIGNGDAFWSGLSQFCTDQAKLRKENGALELDRYDVKLDISDVDNISIQSVRQNTPASLMIQELAILANHLASKYAKENNLPCLFRNQPPYSITRELEEGEKPSLNDINIQPARISLEPEGHSALGLESYLQISSPIRRFLDLVNQMTVMTEMGNRESVFDEEELLGWARKGDEIQREYNQIERKLQDHWKIKYLEQNPGVNYQAYVMRLYRTGRILVNLTEIQLIFECPLDGVLQGEQFIAKIESANSKLNRVLISKIKTEETEQDSSKEPETSKDTEE